MIRRIAQRPTAHACTPRTTQYQHATRSMHAGARPLHGVGTLSLLPTTLGQSSRIALAYAAANESVRPGTRL